VKELSIRVASEPAPPEDEFSRPRRMRLTERLHFIALFILAISLSVLAAIALLPLTVFVLLKEFFARRPR